MSRVDEIAHTIEYGELQARKREDASEELDADRSAGLHARDDRLWHVESRSEFPLAEVCAASDSADVPARIELLHDVAWEGIEIHC